MDRGMLLLLLVCPFMIMFLVKGHNHRESQHGKNDINHQGHDHGQANTSNASEMGRLD